MNKTNQKIYDCFLFFNEVDLLEIRLNELNDLVDFFVIGEAKDTFTGVRRNLILEKLLLTKTFSKFKHKIIYVKIEATPQFIDPMYREIYQRNELYSGLSSAADKDIIMISDVDEIPKKEKFPDKVEENKIYGLVQDFYLYYFNTKAKETWMGIFITMKKNIDTLQRLKTINNKNNDNFISINNAGWHFSWVGGAQKISEKLKSFSHNELDIPKINNINNIKEKMEKNKILYDENRILSTVNIDESYPKYILENLTKFSKYIKKPKNIMKKEKMTFHILCVAHSITSHDYPTDAFVLKTLWLSKMLYSLGHTVYVYGVEGSEIENCTEFINVVPKSAFDAAYGNRDDSAVNNYTNTRGPAWESFTKLGFEEIKKRVNDPKDDFVLAMFGVAHKPLTDKLVSEIGINFIVEPGIGHPGSYAPYRVFESYAWSHWTYGNENKAHPPAFDAVIPHYYYPEYYPFSKEKEDYVMFMGRMIWAKGVTIAIEAARLANTKIVLVGNGNPKDFYRGDMSHVDFVGVKNIYEKVEYLKKAKAFIYPSIYVEPFGQAALEANLCGTPVLASDWGAFTETVQPGINGYRCRNMGDYVWGIKNIDTINPDRCRKWVLDNYHADRIKLMYQEYFERLRTLKTDGYYHINTNRTQLNWLTKKY